MGVDEGAGSGAPRSRPSKMALGAGGNAQCSRYARARQHDRLDDNDGQARLERLTSDGRACPSAEIRGIRPEDGA